MPAYELDFGCGDKVANMFYRTKNKVRRLWLGRNFTLKIILKTWPTFETHSVKKLMVH